MPFASTLPTATIVPQTVRPGAGFRARWLQPRRAIFLIRATAAFTSSGVIAT
jgi:hypothetical protein